MGRRAMAGQFPLRNLDGILSGSPNLRLCSV
jgi:hypothetical protein